MWPFVAVGALFGAVFGSMRHREEVKTRLQNQKTLTLKTKDLAEELISSGKTSLVAAGEEIRANRAPSRDLLLSCYQELPQGSPLAERLAAAFPLSASGGTTAQVFG